MAKNSGSISTAFANSALKQTISAIDDSEFLLVDLPIDKKKFAAKGIHTLFKKFPYETHTFQFIKTDGSGKVTAPARAFKTANDALEQALDYSNKGHDIYFMVNEGDGVVHDGKRVCRSQANVRSLSQCFIDTDNCPVEKVKDYLSKIHLIPHLTIESSPGRFHFYFSFIPVEKTEDNIERWKAVQHMLHRLGDHTIHSPSKSLGTDSTMHDFSKVLRVPGFLHVKKNHMVSVVEDNDIPLYTLDELFDITKAQSFIDYHAESNGVDHHIPDLSSDKFYEAGERYAALQALSMKLANETHVDKSVHYQSFVRFIHTRIDNSDGTYCDPQGLITPKSKALFNSAFSKIQREEKTKIDLINSSLVNVDNPPPDPWSLPDSFYLNAPNGFGDVVKQVMDYSMYPCAALAFGTFLTGLSILKARTHFTPGGSSPALYTMNIAISGYGKGDPITMLQNTFVHHGLKGLIENEIRSDRGIYEHLKINEGFGLFLLDEVAPLIKAIQKEEAATHHAYIAKALLDLYSKGATKGVSFGKVAKGKTKQEQVIVIDNPMVAFCAFTVPHEFNKMFDSDSVAKGLFQRFIPIVADIVDIEKNPNADKHAVIKSPLFTAFIEAQELDGEGNPVHPLQSGTRKRMTFTTEARERFESLSKSYRTAMISAAKDPELAPTSGLYSRLSEQIERIATVLSQEEIELPVLEYAISFIESRHRATLATAGKTLLRGKGMAAEELEEKVLRALAKECQAQSTSKVTKRGVYMRVRKDFPSVWHFEQTLRELEALGKILVTQKESKTGAPVKNQLMIQFLEVL